MSLKSLFNLPMTDLHLWLLQELNKIKENSFFHEYLSIEFFIVDIY